MKPQEFHAKWAEVKVFLETVMDARTAARLLDEEAAVFAREHLLSAALVAVRMHFGLDSLRIPNIEVMRELVLVRTEPELRDVLFGCLVDQRATEQLPQDQKSVEPG